MTISATTDDPTTAKVTAIAGMLLMGGALAGEGGAGLSYAQSGAVVGFTNATLQSGGDLESGLKGAGSGYIMGSVGDHYGDTYSVERIAASTVAGGTASEIMGGQFKDGAGTAFIFSALRYGFEFMKGETNRLKKLAHQNDPNKQIYKTTNGYLDTAGTRGYSPEDQLQITNGKLRTSWLGEFLGMNKEGKPHMYDNIPGVRRFINNVSKPHDFGSQWRYTDQGFFNPFQSQLAAEAFEVYSFVTMPIAGIYTALALVPYDVAIHTQNHHSK
jgi:hypothetical protein